MIRVGLNKAIMNPEQYSVLACAIAARRMSVVTSGAGPAYTDGRTIFVDVTTDPADLADCVAAQAALLAGGSLQKEFTMRLARLSSTVADRYLTLELRRAARQFNQVLPRSTVRRIESSEVQSLSSSSRESLLRAKSREHLPPPPRWAGTVRPSRLRRVNAIELSRSPADADLTRRLDDHTPQSDDAPIDPEGESKIVNLMSAPGVANPLGDAVQRIMGMGRRAPGRQQNAEVPITHQRLGPIGARARMVGLHQLISARSPQRAPVTGSKYPEWDCHRRAYRRDWCTVAEYDVVEVEPPFAPTAISGRSFQRPLARVGNELQRHRRQADGDSLDLSALVDHHANRLKGEDPDARIYENSRRTKRDLSVLVLLDCSGSTSEAYGGQVVFEEERRLSAELTAALERLGDRVATYGFYSRGKDTVRFLRIKDFSGPFDAAAKRRLGSVRPSGFTRMGAAIRHGVHVLKSLALANNMVLLVVGDGLPYDDGYENCYARADVRLAIREGGLDGVAVAGIAVRSSTEPEVLEDVWSEASFRVIGHSRDIQRHLHGLVGSALSMTRSNGRRREVFTEEHHDHLRSMGAAKRNAMNSYV